MVNHATWKPNLYISKLRNKTEPETEREGERERQSFEP